MILWAFEALNSVQQKMHKMNKNQKGYHMDKDTQSDRYQLTINNPQEHNFTHEQIVNILLTNFKTLQFFCMADEEGSCYHTHIFVCFTSRVRFSTIKRHFEVAHIEKVKGSVKNNIDYIKKSGKWENDEKHGTSVAGTYEQYGTPPPETKGKRADMHELYEMIEAGMTNAEILARNQDYILVIEKLDKLRTMLLTEKYRGIRRLDMEVIYCYGETGTGKTRSVMDKHGDESVYKITDYCHPWDGYSCQPVVLFDEFRNSLPLKDMLNLCDIYPLELPARYSNKYACYETVYIVSNWSLETQYQDAQEHDRASWLAFLRRISKVKTFFGNEVITYNSTKEYFNRPTSFIPIDRSPFDEKGE